jgi:2-polyprenyl-3-methyl-5-hydroxy-6-metoxy-1,4-benzoquinol methylase
MTWINIWKNKGIEKSELDAVGYRGTGLTKKSVKQFTNHLIEKMNLLPTESVYEVGCGVGLILKPLQEYGMLVAGSDISSHMISRAKLNLNSDKVYVSEAIDISNDILYDYVISMSVFLYFDDELYATKVVKKMMDKSTKGKIAILDINDFDKKSEFLQLRKKTIPNYDTLYKDLDQLFFSKQFWINLALNNHWKIEIEDNIIKGYRNSPFRYNVFLTR